MSKQLARTAIQGFNNQPSMLAVSHSEYLADTISALSAANAKEENIEAEERRREMMAAFGYESLAEDKPFSYADGIAFIPIGGLLINRFSCSWGWVTGYNFIREQMNAALKDPDVKVIVYDVNSGGGQVAGCFELANEIFASRTVKPSVAVVDASAYSAAYALASSATKIISTPSGGEGSIGVVAMHLDVSRAMNEAGYKVTFIYSGDHKVDGNPYEPLPESVRADIQKSVDTTRQEFVSLVARNRGLDEKSVYDTQARCYSAQEALQMGLIDAIAPPLEAVSAFLNELSGSDNPDKEKDMSKKAEQPGAEGTTAAPEGAQAAQPAQPVQEAAAPADTRLAERQRIKDIQACEEAKGKSQLANHLALDTELSVDDARKILAAAAPEQAQAAPAGRSAFEAAMDTGKHPEVGAEAEAQGQGEQSAAQRIIAAQALATGKKLH